MDASRRHVVDPRMSRIYRLAEVVFNSWRLPLPLIVDRSHESGRSLAVDLRVGGAYRYVWRGDNGNEIGMGGIFREIVRPERIVCAEKFDESWYPGDAVDTTTFVERGGKTTVTTTVLYATREARDGVLKSPMEGGVAKSYDKLAEVLASTISRRGE